MTLYVHNDSFFKLFTFQQSPVTWEMLSGLNRVTESTAKELLIAEISYLTPEECDEKLQNHTNKSSKIVQKLQSVNINEILVKRWVPNQERDSEKS